MTFQDYRGDISEFGGVMQVGHGLLEVCPVEGVVDGAPDRSGPVQSSSSRMSQAMSSPSRSQSVAMMTWSARPLRQRRLAFRQHRVPPDPQGRGNRPCRVPSCRGGAAGQSGQADDRPVRRPRPGRRQTPGRFAQSSVTRSKVRRRCRSSIRAGPGDAAKSSMPNHMRIPRSSCQ